MVQYKTYKLEMDGKVQSHNAEQNREASVLQRKLNDALRYALITCVGGASNKISDLIKTNGWPDALGDRYGNYSIYKKNKVIRKNQYRWYLSEDKAENLPKNSIVSRMDEHPLSEENLARCNLEFPHFKLIEQALIGLEQRSGNCGIRASLIMLYLWERAEGIFRLELFSSRTFDHSWVVVNRDLNSSMEDTSSWGVDCFCVDGWYEESGIVYSASEFDENFEKIKAFARFQLEQIKEGITLSVYTGRKGKITYNQTVDFVCRPDKVRKENEGRWKCFCEIIPSTHQYPYTLSDTERQHSVESYYTLYKSYYPLQVFVKDSDKNNAMDFFFQSKESHEEAFKKCLDQIHNMNQRFSHLAEEITYYKEVVSQASNEKLNRVTQFENDCMALQASIKPITPKTANHDWMLEITKIEKLKLAFFCDMLNYDAQIQAAILETIQENLKNLHANKGAQCAWIDIEICELENNKKCVEQSLLLFNKFNKFVSQLEKVVRIEPKQLESTKSHTKILEKLHLFEDIHKKLSLMMQSIDASLLNIQKLNKISTLKQEKQLINNFRTLELGFMQLKERMVQEHSKIQRCELTLRKNKARNILKEVTNSFIKDLNTYWESRLLQYPTKYKKYNPMNSKRGLFIRNVKNTLEKYSQTGNKALLIQYIEENSCDIYDPNLLDILKRLVITAINFEAKYLSKEEDSERVFKTNIKKVQSFLSMKQLDVDSLFFSAVEYGYMDVLIDLLGHGVDFNKKNSDGELPIYLAVLYRHAHIVAFLAEANIDLNQQDKKYSLAYLAAKFANAEMLEVLALYNAPLNQTHNRGLTPLLVAAERGHLDELKTLVEYGVNPHQVMKNGQTPIFFAALNNQQDMVQYLLDASVDCEIPYYASAKNLREFVSTCDVNTIFRMETLIEKQASNKCISVTAKDIAEVMGYDYIVQLLNVYMDAVSDNNHMDVIDDQEAKIIDYVKSIALQQHTFFSTHRKTEPFQSTLATQPTLENVRFSHLTQ